MHSKIGPELCWRVAFKAPFSEFGGGLKMCTLTFIPKPQGYLLGMNRDERLTRETAFSPEAITASNISAVYPRESGGGTWIGSNAAGITFALLNQNPGAQAREKERSRGEIIPALLESTRFPNAMRRFQHLYLHGMLPFVLVGIFPAEQIISQCQWDGNGLKFLRIGWDVRHWFSSGVSDEMARKVRGSTCYEAWRRRDAGSVEWLRGLHASHSPARGSFSICVHRPDAATVSYTEASFIGSALSMRYHAGHACQALGRFDAEVDLHATSQIATAS
ncbi:MAG TPA: NRDE family protein [Candidatus Binatia bacterium]|nr:NRDE family protein [Candidatus Binatia bacterium]